MSFWAVAFPLTVLYLLTPFRQLEYFTFFTNFEDITQRVCFFPFPDFFSPGAISGKGKSTYK